MDFYFSHRVHQKSLNESEFRWTLLQDQMAFDKLHEGIKKFAEDREALKALLRQKLAA